MYNIVAGGRSLERRACWIVRLRRSGNARWGRRCITVPRSTDGVCYCSNAM